MKLDVQDQGGGRILDTDGQKGWGFLKIGQFHEHHMCIIPNAAMWFDKEVFFGLQEQLISHFFLFCKFISTKKP